MSDHPALEFLEQALGDDPLLLDAEVRMEAMNLWPAGGIMSETAQHKFAAAIMRVIRERRRKLRESSLPPAHQLALQMVEADLGADGVALAAVRVVIEAEVESLRDPATGEIPDSPNARFFGDVVEKARAAYDHVQKTRQSLPGLVPEITDEGAMMMHAAAAAAEIAPEVLSPVASRAARPDAPGTSLEQAAFRCDVGHEFQHPIGQNDAEGKFVKFDRVACPIVVDVAYGGIYKKLGGTCCRDARRIPPATVRETDSWSDEQLLNAITLVEKMPPNEIDAGRVRELAGSLAERLKKRNALVVADAGARGPLAVAIAKTADLPGTGARREAIALGEATGVAEVDDLERFSAIRTHPEVRVEVVRADSGDERLSDIKGDVEIFGGGFAAARGQYIALWYQADGKYPQYAAHGDSIAAAVTNVLRIKLERELEMTRTGRETYDAGGGDEPPGMAFRNREGMAPRRRAARTEAELTGEDGGAPPYAGFSIGPQ